MRPTLVGERGPRTRLHPTAHDERVLTRTSDHESRYSSFMGDAEERKRARAAWTGQVFRGPGSLGALEAEALSAWAAMAPLDRLALTWELSLEQYGGSDGTTMEPRLPRSAYRLERR